MLPPILALSLLALPQESAPACRPSDHAPAGLMDPSCPLPRAWMVSLRTEHTRFQGLRDGAKRVTTDEALGMGYDQVPQSMSMTMSMLELMYAPTEMLNVSASIPWIENTMRMRTTLGESFSMDSSGVGDTEVGADLVAWQLDEQSLRAGVSLGLPTGSITERGGMPGAPATKLEYSMQLGSGTYDLLPRLSWRMRSSPYSYGIDFSGAARLGHNDEHYALGDRFVASAFGSQDWSGSWAGTLRVTATRVGNVRGADPELDPMMSPTNDPKLQGYERFDGAVGVNWMPLEGKLAGSVIGLELGIPLAQDLEGPQLSEDWFAALRIGLSF